jgi:hypothetical protein
MSTIETHQIFLIRGLARENRHWGAFLNDLTNAYSARGIQLRIETIDLPAVDGILKCGLARPSKERLTLLARE